MYWWDSVGLIPRFWCWEVLTAHDAATTYAAHGDYNVSEHTVCIQCLEPTDTSVKLMQLVNVYAEIMTVKQEDPVATTFKAGMYLDAASQRKAQEEEEFDEYQRRKRRQGT